MAKPLGLAKCLLALLSTGFIVACGPEFEPASVLSSLRIIAVKKDDPFLRVRAPQGSAAAGDTYQPDNVAEMTVAIEDARPRFDKVGALQKLWFAGCSNPPGDSYFTCLLSVWLAFKAYDAIGPGPLAEGQTWGLSDADPAKLAAFVTSTFPGQSLSGAASSSGAGGLDQAMLLEQAMALRVGSGDHFRYEVPSWLIDRHAPSADPDVPRYGQSLVFFYVCDGKIGLSEQWKGDINPLEVLTDATRGFPLACYHPITSEPRTPDNFDLSNSNLYAYESLSNKNPLISGVEFDKKTADMSAICIGDVCDPNEDACANPNAPHIKRCEEDRVADCPWIDVSPVLSEKQNSEVDVVATNAGRGGGELFEQMWLRYFADHGRIRFETKRLQDATDGWFKDHGTEWQVPRSRGTARIWSVARDNRGGVDWARLSVCVTD